MIGRDADKIRTHRFVEEITNGTALYDGPSSDRPVNLLIEISNSGVHLAVFVTQESGYPAPMSSSHASAYPTARLTST